MTWRNMKEWTFQMEKEQKLLFLHHSTSQTPTPPQLPAPRISSAPLSPPRPLTPPPLTPRSCSSCRTPRRLSLQLQPPAPAFQSWSAARQQNGDSRTPVWTRVSSVSPGRRTAASSTDERVT